MKENYIKLYPTVEGRKCTDKKVTVISTKGIYIG